MTAALLAELDEALLLAAGLLALADALLLGAGLALAEEAEAARAELAWALNDSRNTSAAIVLTTCAGAHCRDGERLVAAGEPNTCRSHRPAGPGRAGRSERLSGPPTGLRAL